LGVDAAGQHPAHRKKKIAKKPEIHNMGKYYAVNIRSMAQTFHFSNCPKVVCTVWYWTDWGLF